MPPSDPRLPDYKDHEQRQRAHSLMEQRSFLLLLALVSLLFLYLLQPFFSPIFWACVITILFYPLHLRLLDICRSPSMTSLLTLHIVALVGVAPALFLVNALVQEAGQLYELLESGDMDPATYLDRVRKAFPLVQIPLDYFDIDIDSIKELLTESTGSISRWAAENTLTIGQNMLKFVVGLALMLYLMFFLLRDGPSLIQMLIRALPLGDEREQLLFDKFAEVTRATVKGNLIVAMVQGALGGFIFAVLGIPGAIFWGVIMVLLSLIPVVGASLIWGPVAIYLFAVGDWERGTVLTVFGAVVIGLIDNLLRPLLVGRDTKLPDYLVLLSTLGGFAIFGMNGFVIGPLIAVLFVAFWQIFILDFNTLPDNNEPLPDNTGSLEDKVDDQIRTDPPARD